MTHATKPAKLNSVSTASDIAKFLITALLAMALVLAQSAVAVSTQPPVLAISPACAAHAHAPASAGASTVSCCDRGTCECSITSSDRSSRPAPATAFQHQHNVKPVLSADVTFRTPSHSPRLAGTSLPRRTDTAAAAHRPPALRLHCILLI
ncbi:hypothetical protein DB346_20970 [Verrucomicrobia bacterium LW23]|nr:hypothetical protein DB346_20970 [Verrucomicrobia bacterium LW23]